MEFEIINTNDKLIIESSKTTRYLGYPRKLPLWQIKISLPKMCKIFRTDINSDISLEIENGFGIAFVPALSSKEGILRLETLLKDFKLLDDVLRV